MRIALHAQMNHRFRLPGVEPLTDEELQSITTPTVVIVAGKSAPFAPRVQAERAGLIPNGDVEVIRGARHDVSWTHVDQCVAHLSQIAT
jgi:pimeloyl-ACP methyl ester carboxylesterase